MAVAEGNAGSANAVFTVTLSAASGKQVTVQYGTADGSAAAGSDYTNAAGTLTFAAGVTTQKITVAVLGDTLFELDEDYSIALTSPANATISDAVGRGTILNDDAASLVVTNTNDSGPGSLRQAIITANLTAGNPHTITLAIPGAGPHVISLATSLPALADPLGLDVPAGKRIQIGAGSGPTFNGFSQLDKVGAGRLVLGGVLNYAPGAVLTALSGELELATDGGSGLAVQASSTVVFSASQHLAALSIGDGQTAQLLPGGGVVLAVPSLAMGNGAMLDLADNDLIVQATAATRDAVLAEIQSRLGGGFQSGSWNGVGIHSSAAAADAGHLTALGYLLNDSGGSALYNVFDGTPVDRNAVLVKYTYFGDTNLDGLIDGTDYALTDNGYNFSLSGWINGDFNFDGSVDGTDYALLDNAYNMQSAPLSAAKPASVQMLLATAAEATLAADPGGDPAGSGDGFALLLINRAPPLAPLAATEPGPVAGFALVPVAGWNAAHPSTPARSLAVDALTERELDKPASVDVDGAEAYDEEFWLALAALQA